MSRRKYRCLVRVLSDHDTADYCQLRITSIWQMERVACPDIARELSLLGRGIRNVLAMHAVQGGQAWGAYEADALLRSEEHTSELQSLMRISYAVFCLKKKKKTK